MARINTLSEWLVHANRKDVVRQILITYLKSTRCHRTYGNATYLDYTCLRLLSSLSGVRPSLTLNETNEGPSNHGIPFRKLKKKDASEL